MHKIWGIILPGFNGLDSLSLLIGLVEVSLGSYLIGYIIVPTYNFLIRKKVSEHKIEVKPIIVRFKILFVSFAVYISILFTLCLLYDLIVPAEYQMLALWKLLLPGFTGLTFSNYLLGLGEITIYSVYTAYIFSITLNFFEKSQLKKSEENPLPQWSPPDTDIKVLNVEGDEFTKGETLGGKVNSPQANRSARKKYDEKYCGVALGVFAVFVFILGAQSLCLPFV